MIGTAAFAILIAVGSWPRLDSPAQPQRVARAPAPASSSASASAPVAAAPRGRPASVNLSTVPVDVIEVCGVGPVRVDRGDTVAAYRIIGNLTRNSAARWMAAMLDSDDLRTRAAGLLLEGKISDGVAAEPTVDRARDELVQLAVGSADPAVYAMARWACGIAKDEPDGACARLSIGQWARMDSDNAIPWLALATQARTHGDTAAEKAAFTRAAAAHRSDSYLDTVFRTAEAAVPPDVTALQHWFLTIEVGGISAALQAPYGIVSKHCSPEALADDAVRSECKALADVLTSRSGDLLGAIIGGNLGERVGWPGERVAAWATHRKALEQAIAQAGPAGNDDMWTCNTVELANAFTSQRVRLGEMGAAQDALDRSGETEHQMAGKWEEARRRIVDQAP